MGSQSPSTRIQPPPPPPSSPPGEGLDVLTLLLSAVASASAAYVTSKVWAPGALGAAAMSPVIVALVKEALRKPADIVTSAVPTPRGLARRPPLRSEPLPEDLTERLGAGAAPPFPPPAAGAPAGPVRVYSTRARRLRWRLAVVTGLLGFVVCVVAYTVPEVIAGRSVVSSGHKTTLWGGDRHKSSGGGSTTTTETTTAPASTAPGQQTQTQTVTVPETVTVAPPTATQPAPTTTTAPPAAGTTIPQAPPEGTQTAPAG